MSGNVIIGAGPAGLGCAHALTNVGCERPVIVERNDSVGGLCRTLNFYGYLFDIGGHRFLTKHKEVDDLWHSIMRGDMLEVERCSHIFYRKKYFKYPLSYVNVARNLGPFESIRCLVSFLIKGDKPEKKHCYESWLINKFGKRLYENFFKTYSEKVWGLSCDEISSDWASQRLPGISLRTTIQHALGISDEEDVPKSFYSKFYYPKKGPGDFFSRFAIKIRNQGAEILCKKTVLKVAHNGTRIEAIQAYDQRLGNMQSMPVDHLFSSMPLDKLIASLHPSPPEKILEAMRNLKFRSFITVNIIIDKKDVFPSQWIYVHSPSVRLARIQNYKNWSADMVADDSKTSLGLEYFCQENDELWSMDDVNLIAFATAELEKLSIVSRRHLINGFVVRCADAYPIYTIEYKTYLKQVRDYLNRFENMSLIGRAARFRYCNMDDALLSGMYAANDIQCV